MNGKYKKLALLSLISLNFSAFGMFTTEKGTNDDYYSQKEKELAGTQTPPEVADYDWLAGAELAALKTPNKDDDLSFFTFDPSRISPEALGGSLIHEVKYGNIHNAKRLINLGANMAFVNETGNTALLAAVSSNNQEFVDLLLEKAKERKQHILTRDILNKIAEDVDENPGAQEMYDYLEEKYYERNES